MPEDRVRTAEVVGALCLATDLGMGFPFGFGVGSSVLAMRLGERLGVDEPTAVQTYYGCLLFYAGCTADADVQAHLFPDGLTESWTGVMFGSQRQSMAAVFQALGGGEGGRVTRTLRAAARLARAGRGYKEHTAALCEVAEMLAAGVGLPPEVSGQFRLLTERWDGGGPLERAAGAELPLSIRIVQVARDAHVQRRLHGPAGAVEVLRDRAGAAFDPAVVDALSVDLLDEPATWAEAMAAEPGRHRTLEGPQIDDALTALAAFADLADVVGHSSAVADLAARAAKHLGRSDDEVAVVRRAGLVHDLGKVGVPFRVWQHGGDRSADDWEKVRLHPYYTERTLSGSPYLTGLGEVARCHHERLDGSGYHRGVPASALDLPARLLAVADAYRSALESGADPAQAAGGLRDAARTGTLDADAVAAVLEAAGHPPERIARPGGLTQREEQTLALLAHGLTTREIGRGLGVTPKTADHYVQQVYAKIGVSTRAAAAVYAMQHGLATEATRESSR